MSPRLHQIQNITVNIKEKVVKTVIFLVLPLTLIFPSKLVRLSWNFGYNPFSTVAALPDISTNTYAFNELHQYAMLIRVMMKVCK